MNHGKSRLAVGISPAAQPLSLHMAIITLLTDFGTTDPFVGIMKGVVLQINPQATIVDISHQIDPQDVFQAAHEINYYCRYFPEDTVHIVVVDPGVGTDRAVLAMRWQAQTLLAPDNGVLSLILQDHPKPEMVRVTNERFFRKPVSRTFHGRDIFAPVAAHLSLGVPLTALGDPIASSEAAVLATPKPRMAEDGSLIGSIVAIDRFGNLITDIDPDTVRRFFPDVDQESLLFTVGGRVIAGVAETYDVVGQGELLVLIGSRGRFEFSVNRGSAAGLLGTKRCDTFRVRSGRADSSAAV